MRYRIDKTKHFQKSYHKLPLDIQEAFKETLVEFFADPFSPKLRTHKLKGKLSIYYSSSVNYTHRFIWTLEKDLITLANIGNHDIYL